MSSEGTPSKYSPTTKYSPAPVIDVWVSLTLPLYRRWRSRSGQAKYVLHCWFTPILTVSPDEIILWNAQVEDPPEETYPTDTNFVDVDPEPGPELEEDDLAEHPSFARTDDSDSSKLKENIRQPDFVVLAKAFDAPLHCHSVWEVKTFFSYSTNHKKGAYPALLA